VGRPDEELLWVTVEPNWATWLAGDPPHADTTSVSPARPPSADAWSVARVRRRHAGLVDGRTRPMIARPDNNHRSRQ
jgi:hypothetical protein